MDSLIIYQVSDGRIVRTQTSSEALDEAPILAAFGPGFAAVHLAYVPPHGKIARFIDGHITEEEDPAQALLDVKAQLADSDAGMARVTEDLIDALVAAGKLSWADLPASVKQKIDQRKQLRAKLA